MILHVYTNNGETELLVFYNVHSSNMQLAFKHQDNKIITDGETIL